MNAAHFHLMMNHLPLWALLSGWVLVILGYFRRSEELKGVGFLFWVMTAVLAWLAFSSGHRAEDLVEHMPEISKTVLHQHEEGAETAFGASIGLGILSAVLLLARARLGKAGIWLSRFSLVLAIFTLVCMAWVADLGGQVHHSELRAIEPIQK